MRGECGHDTKHAALAMRATRDVDCGDALPEGVERFAHNGRGFEQTRTERGACRLKQRAKDVDFGYRQILVRDGKGGKDRITMLPAAVAAPLQAHLERVKVLHERDAAQGFGDVELPDAIARKYPRAPYEWGWKFVFPSHKRSVDRGTRT